VINRGAAEILVRCVTEHEYGERGSAGDREMGGKTERGWGEGKHGPGFCSITELNTEQLITLNN
jgi:hypothetical protein